jgi:hypothetical protein
MSAETKAKVAQLREKLAKAKIAHYREKLGRARKGSKLSANMKLRIGIAKASMVEDAEQRKSLVKAAREEHVATLAAIASAEAEETEAAPATP